MSKSRTKKRLPSPGSSPRDKYLKKKFNRSEEEYNKVFEAQGSVCYICHEPQIGKSLHLDHDHRLAARKIISKKEKGFWVAWPDGEMLSDSPLNFTEEGRTKPEALRKVRQRLLRLSCRGILCWRCNRALPRFRDSSELLQRASDYIRNYNRFIIGTDRKSNGFTI